MLEQLQWSAENVCSTYHVPPYKIGVGAQPTYNNVQSLNVEYYSQCLQSLLEDAESCLDDGLGLGDQYDLGVEFDVDNLLRMDTASQADATTKLVGGSILTPNEGAQAVQPEAARGRRHRLHAAAELFARGAGEARRAGGSVRHQGAGSAPCRTATCRSGRPTRRCEGGCQQSGARTAEVAPPACSRLKSQGWANERDGPGGCHRACLARTRRCHHCAGARAPCDGREAAGRCPGCAGGPARHRRSRCSRSSQKRWPTSRRCRRPQRSRPWCLRHRMARTPTRRRLPLSSQPRSRRQWPTGRS